MTTLTIDKPLLAIQLTLVLLYGALALYVTCALVGASDTFGFALSIVLGLFGIPVSVIIGIACYRTRHLTRARLATFAVVVAWPVITILIFLTLPKAQFVG